MAYGHSESGKSHTIMGKNYLDSDYVGSLKRTKPQGITFEVIQTLFTQMTSPAKVYVQMCLIRKEKIVDLLNPKH